MRITGLAIFALSTLVLATGCSDASSESADAKSPQATQIEVGPELIERVSPHSFDETVAKVRAGIEQRPLTVFAEIDHGAGAANADLELAPSTLFIFGNPKGGTPLMAREPRMGIALPLKIHVYEAGGKVIVSHTDMTALAQRYGLDPEAQPMPNIIGLLDGLAAEASE